MEIALVANLNFPKVMILPMGHLELLEVMMNLELGMVNLLEV